MMVRIQMLVHGSAAPQTALSLVCGAGYKLLYCLCSLEWNVLRSWMGYRNTSASKLLSFN